MSATSGRVALIALAVIVFVYLGARYGVRFYVDHEIEKHSGQSVPEFSLNRVDGGPPIGNADIKGRVAIFHFSRSRCINCEHEKEVIRAFEATLDPSKVFLITINTDPVMGFPIEETKATVARAGFKHPTVLATERFLNEFHGSTWARVTPVTYFVDRGGVIRTSLRGEQTLESLRSALALF